MYKKIFSFVVLSSTLLQSGCIIDPSYNNVGKDPGQAPVGNVDPSYNNVGKDPGQAPVGNVVSMPGQI